MTWWEADRFLNMRFCQDFDAVFERARRELSATGQAVLGHFLTIFPCAQWKGTFSEAFKPIFISCKEALLHKSGRSFIFTL